MTDLLLGALAACAEPTCQMVAAWMEVTLIAPPSIETSVVQR